MQLTAAAIFVSGGAAAQQTCADIEAVVLQCPDGAGISGEPPRCACDGVPVEPLELSCAINFGCPTSGEVGFGDWPACACRPADEGVGQAGGGGGGEGGTGPIGGSLGGVATCEQFFECPSGAEMEVVGGQCTCTLVMLPAFKE